jgi:hypothetical protein
MRAPRMQMRRGASRHVDRWPPIGGRACRILSSRALAATVLSIGVSCASLHVPSSAPQFESSAWVSSESEGVELRAVPLEGKESYWELFDENLPALGIVALWVEFRNHRQTQVTLTDAPWRLQIPAGKTGSLDAAQVMKRYHSRTGSRMYSISAEAEARGKLERLLFMPGVLAPGRARTGFLFFAVDPKQEVRWNEAATLIGPPVRCAGYRTVTIELALDYATP